MMRRRGVVLPPRRGGPLSRVGEKRSLWRPPRREKEDGDGEIIDRETDDNAWDDDLEDGEGKGPSDRKTESRRTDGEDASERERDKERQRRKEWKRERANREEKDRRHRDRDRERDRERKKDKDKPKARSPQPPSRPAEAPKQEATAGPQVFVLLRLRLVTVQVEVLLGIPTALKSSAPRAQLCPSVQVPECEQRLLGVQRHLEQQLGAQRGLGGPVCGPGQPHVLGPAPGPPPQPRPRRSEENQRKKTALRRKSEKGTPPRSRPSPRSPRPVGSPHSSSQPRPPLTLGSPRGSFVAHKKIKLTLLNKAADKGSGKRYEPVDKDRQSPPAKRATLSPDRGSRDRKSGGRLGSPERQRSQNSKALVAPADRKLQLSPQSKSSSKMISVPGKAADSAAPGAKAGKASTVRCPAGRSS
ncbi:Zinc finger CCCH domain-containing protein 18 [Heterocephalus glaber]|uniref:Zinc finger CCCH domain-containing protein 18 n=1 Tax=Heterocephalus glaber TaxID=10181 RepID=G5ARN3_HETGA|nr:Zinc finger CCCH domain-containing protein 18 [Heterocephalus glaber]